jgi:hypothetical protein
MSAKEQKPINSRKPKSRRENNPMRSRRFQERTGRRRRWVAEQVSTKCIMEPVVLEDELKAIEAFLGEEIRKLLGAKRAQKSTQKKDKK